MENKRTASAVLSSFIAGTVTVLLVIIYVEVMVKLAVWFWSLI